MPRFFWVFCGACLALCACSVKQSRLLTHNDAGVGQGGASSKDGSSDYLNISGNGPVTPAVAAAIDERPIGGASLNGGTTGGGTYVESLAAGQLYYVDNVEGIHDLAESAGPKVILIAEGTYDFTLPGTELSGCFQACGTATPVAEQFTTTTVCAGDSVKDTHDTLRMAPNKTLIGLGKGATFSNITVSLSVGTSNAIFRNLTIENVTPNVITKGVGLNIWSGDHVWVDHCTFRNIGKSYLNISSDIDSDTYAISQESGYITITNNYFDGKVDGICEQRSQFVVGTRRNPALTLAYNRFERSFNRNPFLFGPETWAHVFNNSWSDISYAGLAVACDASVIMQGNSFESTNSLLSINDNGADATDSPYCAAKPWGKAYAPMKTGTDEDNLYDDASTLTLHSQPTDGTGITKPSRVSGHRFRLTVPTDPGATETYEVTLNADPATVAAQVKAGAGAGNLF